MKKLEVAEIIIKGQKKRIYVLERVITDLGGEIPKNKEIPREARIEEEKH